MNDWIEFLRAERSEEMAAVADKSPKIAKAYEAVKQSSSLARIQLRLFSTKNACVRFVTL